MHCDTKEYGQMKFINLNKKACYNLQSEVIILLFAQNICLMI